MDNVFKIKRTCYRPSELEPGSLFALTSISPFIRIYLGVDSSGNHFSRVIRAYGCDVNSYPVLSFDPRRLNLYKVVRRHQ